MSIKTVDRDLNHLYPPFREKLLEVLDEASSATGEAWRMSEGYRSPERQTWLYAQGRTRPGKIVTWMKTPKWHGTGLAADVLPSKKGYGAPMSYWNKLREVYHAHGLSNPAWGNGDLGHVQMTDNAMRQKALAWIRAGFPAAPAPAPASRQIAVFVDGQEVPDADGYLDPSNHVWVALRPIADALDCSITVVKAKVATVVTDKHECRLDLSLKGGRGFVQATTLRKAKLCKDVLWDKDTRSVRVTA
jgi:hypothetical protein